MATQAFGGGVGTHLLRWSRSRLLRASPRAVDGVGDGGTAAVVVGGAGVEPPKALVAAVKKVTALRTPRQHARHAADGRAGVALHARQEMMERMRRQRGLMGEEGKGPGHEEAGGRKGGGNRRQRRKRAEMAGHRLGWVESTASDPGIPEAPTYGPSESLAYTHLYALQNYAVLAQVLGAEVARLRPAFRPRRVLEFGCGAAMGIVAAEDTWGRGSVQDAIGIDRSQSQLEIARTVLQEYAPGLSRRTLFLENLRNCLDRARRRGDLYDMVIMSNVLLELPNDMARIAAVRLLFETLAPGGMMVIAEHGSRDHSYHVRCARQLLLDQYGANPGKRRASAEEQALLDKWRQAGRQLEGEDGEDGEDETNTQSKRKSRRRQRRHASVLAPCTHDRPCPLRSKDYCAFQVRHEGRTCSYSYVVVQRGDLPRSHYTRAGVPCEYTSAADASASVRAGADVDIDGEDDAAKEDLGPPTPLEFLQELVQECETSEAAHARAAELEANMDWDTYEHMYTPEEWSRVVLRHPLRRGRHVRMDLCTSDGELIKRVASRGQFSRVPAAWHMLRKASVGGMIPNLDVLLGSKGRIVPSASSAPGGVGDTEAEADSDEVLNDGGFDGEALDVEPLVAGRLKKKPSLQRRRRRRKQPVTTTQLLMATKQEAPPDT